MRSKRCAIIGAGIAGLASAIRLVNKGYHVAVYEANDYVGGKFTELQLGPYRFDAGPSLFTMPELVEDLYTLSGKQVQHYFTYQRLATLCNYFYEDGTHISAHQEAERFAEEIAENTADQKKDILEYLQESEKKYDLIKDIFLFRSLHKFKNYINRKTLKGIIHLPFLGVCTSMNTHHQKKFKDPKTIQLFNRFATYNGSDPFRAPAILSMIPHLEHHLGAYFPHNGMYSIIKGLHQLARDLGVQLHMNSSVEEILYQGKQVYGIKVNGQKENYEVVVSNIDIYPTYKKLLPGLEAPEKKLAQERSSSGLIFYWGINKKIEQLDLHNIFFSKDYAQEFEYIFKKGKISPDPTIYVNISSKMNSIDAPAHAENWFVMVNAPAASGQNWEQIIRDTREQIIQKLERVLKQELRTFIDKEAILSPDQIAQKTGSYQGALYGSSSNSRYAAFLRHANFTSKLKNLYFCGGSVHPGGGIPLCLASAKIVSDLIK